MKNKHSQKRRDKSRYGAANRSAYKTAQHNGQVHGAQSISYFFYLSCKQRQKHCYCDKHRGINDFFYNQSIFLHIVSFRKKRKITNRFHEKTQTKMFFKIRHNKDKAPFSLLRKRRLLTSNFVLCIFPRTENSKM